MVRPSGLIITSGPAGSGKTTILYSLLREVVENPALKIMSVEDPVEYSLESVVQLPVRRGHGVTQSHLIRSVMRQDPDVLLVGELRERETLDLVVQVALTGHLVLAQMHGRTATEIVPRLSDMGAPWWLLREALLGVSCQRLVRLLCKECREEYEIPGSVLQDLPLPDDGAPKKAWRPKGCDACSGTGYRGRNAIIEQLEPGEGFWKALEAGGGGATEEDLRRVAIGGGMRTMWMHGWDLIRRGDTSLEEVARVLGGIQP